MSSWSLSKVPSQKGKVVIVTGANSGIGFETALALAKKDMTVILACRSVHNAEIAKKNILSSHQMASVDIIPVDMSNLESVEKFTLEFHRLYDRLDILINNAGIMMSPPQETIDGFENQLATNYIGHFALTGRLMPTLLKTNASRVVTLSSLSYKWSEIQFDDLHFQKGYNKKKAYGQSKRACLIFAYELQRRLSEVHSNTKSMAAHPGLSKTNLDRYFNPIIRPLGALFLQKQEKGALPVLFAALEEDLKGGEYIGPDGFKEMRGGPTIVDSDTYSRDEKVAAKLWEISEKMTNVLYFSSVLP